MGGPAFLTHVVHVLVPTVQTGDIVVIDNLPCHKNASARAAKPWPPEKSVKSPAGDLYRKRK